MSTKRRSKKITADDARDSDALWEWQIPLALVIVGFITLMIGAFVAYGSSGIAGALALIVLSLVLYVPVTVAAMYAVASILGVSFGFLNTAILKLAGISLFTLSLRLLGHGLGFPIIGWLAAVIATYVLFSYCFYLEAMDTIKSVVLISLIGGGLQFVVVGILGGLVAASGAAPSP
jgi:hypothetical protein